MPKSPAGCSFRSGRWRTTSPRCCVSTASPTGARWPRWPLRWRPACPTLAGAPATLTRFIGRDLERALLLGALREGLLVTLHGPGGVGKTRLTVEVARAAGSLFPSRRMFIDLIPARDGYVAQAVAAALGVSERPGESLEDAIAARMGDGRFLLI